LLLPRSYASLRAAVNADGGPSDGRLAWHDRLGYGRTDAPYDPGPVRARVGPVAPERARRAPVLAARSGVSPVLRRLAALRGRVRGAPGLDDVVVRARHTRGSLDRARAGRGRVDLPRPLRVGRTAVDASVSRPLRLPALRLGTPGARGLVRTRVPRPRRVQYLQ